MKAAGLISDWEEEEFDKLALVKNLLEHGADVNTKNIVGELHTIIFIISIHSSILGLVRISSVAGYPANFNIQLDTGYPGYPAI